MPRNDKSSVRRQTGASGGSSDATSGDAVEQQIQKIVEEFERTLRERITGAPGTLEEIEEESQRIGEAVKEIVERERLEGKGAGYEGAYALCPHCGHDQSRYRGHYVRCILTRAAERRLRRAYYYCDRCHRGFCPLDAQLGGLAGSFSLGVWSLVTRFSSYVPYAQAVRELAEVCGIQISPSSVQRIARASGPRSVQILDYWHVSEYIAQIARLRFGGKTDRDIQRGRQWAQAQEEHLLQGRADKFIASLRRWKPATKEAGELRRTQMAYYAEHRGRLRYGDYRAAGWHIGSSTAESGNNHVIQQRMKRPGMRWSNAGAQAMLHLRAAVCSTDRPSHAELARKAMNSPLN